MDAYKLALLLLEIAMRKERAVSEWIVQHRQTEDFATSFETVRRMHAFDGELLRTSVEDVCNERKCPEFIKLVHPMLCSMWNDSLEWAMAIKAANE